MAKRTRGTSRPGQRRPIQRPAARPAPAPAPAPERESADWTSRLRPSGSLTSQEEARAAELEEQIRAEERAAQQQERQARDRAKTADLAGTRREAAPLAVRAAAEYAYVRRDILRIGRVAAILFAALAVFHVLINVMGISPV